jgi:uncharacterized protein DUF72
MPRVFVGESRLPKNFKRYARQFSLLELDCEPGNLPGKEKLQSCVALAPEGFAFNLVVPSRVASLEAGAELDKGFKAALNVARILKAQWWVVRTPAEVRPTRRSREGLVALATRLKETGMRVAWEPRGLWDEVAAAEAADAAGVTLVQDVAREAPRPGPVLYSRLLALGRGARVGLSLADLVVERMRAYEEAFVVVEGQGAREIQQALGIAAADEVEGDILPNGLDEGEGDDDGDALETDEELDEDDLDEDGLEEEDEDLDDARAEEP